MSSSGASIEVSITIDDITHLLTWSPNGRVSLFRRERGELSTCGTGAWDGLRIGARPQAIRGDLLEALEAALRLALQVKRDAEIPTRSLRAKALRPLVRPDAPPRSERHDSQRFEPAPESIDVVWGDDEETSFFRRLVDPPA
jgi:hypothetical protein